MPNRETWTPLGHGVTFKILIAEDRRTGGSFGLSSA